MMKLLIVLALVAYGQTSVVKRSEGSACYRCSTFDSLGQGFMPAEDNPSMCGHYEECWKSKDSGVITSQDRWCPPGTWVDVDEIRLGAPCTLTECNSTMCDDCGVPTASTPDRYECPYHQCNGAADFCYWLGTQEEMVGTCGEGGYFNDTDGICTCTNMTVDCTCKVSIPLHDDIDSHGCNGGWVGQLGMPAMATIENSCGRFGGYDSALENGAHLGTFVIDGAFAGAWVHSLKWTASFTVDPTTWAATPNGAKWGVLSYGDCAADQSMGFNVEKDTFGAAYLVAILETMQSQDQSLSKHTTRCAITPGTKYHVAALWDDSHETNNLKLHCFTSAEWTTCQGDSSQCTISDSTTVQEGTATPRGCGLVIGFTGSDTNDEFFIGEICNVSVDIGSDWSNLYPCV